VIRQPNDRMTSDALDVVQLHQAVEVQAARQGERVAIDEGSRRLSYAELADAMNRLASLILRAGTARNDRVAILIDNGIEACEAMLGILRADCCYVPLNPQFPALRLASIVDQAEPKVIVTTRENLSLLNDVLGEMSSAVQVGIIVLDMPAAEASKAVEAGSRRRISGISGSDDLAAASSAPPPCRNTEEDLAYILFTSGTTGTPKGVMVAHRNIKATIRWGVDYFGITPDDRLSNHSRLSFDVSMFDIFCSFFAGATVCPLMSQGDCAFPGTFIRARKITIWFSVPSVIGMMIKARQLQTGVFESLRAALFAGEPILPTWVDTWREYQPQVPIYNLYGPTEASIVCTVHDIGVDSPFEPDKPVPIGRETRGSELIVLKHDSDELAAPDEVGRLFICGAQVATGYWRQPESTEAAFRVNPLKRELGARMYDTGDLAFRSVDGILHFVGRQDSQVKIRGYRIELGEIETVLGNCAGVHEAVALYIPGEDPVIIAVIGTGEAPNSPGDDAVFDHLERHLPAYMIPRRLVFLRELPRNDAGKVDRNRLLAEFGGARFPAAGDGEGHPGI